MPLLKRPENCVNTPGTLLSVALWLHCGLAPPSKLSENTVLAPCVTTTLSIPQLSLSMLSKPSSANLRVDVPDDGVKLSVTLR